MKKKASARDIALIGMMTATIEVAKSTLAFLPNVELVSFLIILYTLYFGKRVFFAITAFTFLEGFLYGFGLWWLMYLYAWPLLAILTLLFRKQTSAWVFSTLSGFFGLFFGLLCTIPYLFLSGIKGAFAWWVAGIPFDLVHCVSNFILCLILYHPMRKALHYFSRFISETH